MVAYIKSDLEFILDQIKIAEAHAGGQPLFGDGGLIPTYNLAFGLRTVDGSYNHLLPGQEQWGASDQPFPEGLGTDYRPADGTTFDPDGPGGAPAMPTAPNYNPSNNPNSLVFDSSVRTISNLIVDQTLANPVAIMVALDRAGVPGDHLAIVNTIQALFTPIEGLFLALDAATVASTAARAAADANPGDPDLEAAAVAAEQATADAQATLDGARGTLDVALAANGIEMDGNNVSIPNVAPDEGLSASFNSWFTLFGQFFDHGLDLVNKGGSGTVFIPLQPDDPLYVEGGHTNFMVLTRATVGAGTDGVMGTADDVRPINHTTAYVDQNQTYTSHASHQVFIRQYELNADGKPVATGNLIEGANGGMATWGEVKAQALMLGIRLEDRDVGNVPLLRTDQYGNLIPNAEGYAQVITGIGADLIPNTADDIVVSGTPSAPITPTGVFAIRTGHAFLADIAHNAVPNGLADGDIEVGLGNNSPNSTPGYDNELLDAHYIAGDGRVNENIGLTAVHHVFHSEHNRLAEHTKSVVLADAQEMLAGGATQAEAVAFLNEWLADDVNAVPASLDGLVWDGERIFQAAKFGTEMQYQHLVFEEFARKVQPNINVFLVPDGFDTTIDPSIVAEFAHVVYRFGHSMLNESIDRFSETFASNHIGLIEGFLNPLQFDQNGTGASVDHGISAGDIIRGMTRQVGNEIDEFVTTALRNNLLGLPLDLATINLARGRDTGVPSLNEARRQFYEATNQEALLKPYESWVDFAAHLKNEASIINFIASYGTHASITSVTTIEEKRDAAMLLVFGDMDVNGDGTVDSAPADRIAFLNATGDYAGGSLGGLENIDLWIGGLAEQTMPFGGMLGSTFNFVFEVQMEKLQSGDRFYYLQRLDGLHLFGEMENNSFAAMIERNTNASHLPSDVFSTPGLILEVDRSRQFNDLDGDGTLENGDPLGGSILSPLVIRDNPGTAAVETNYLRYTGDEHVVLGGTNNADTLISSIGDDTLYGDGGNDRLEGGFGNDIINGGDGDDIIRDAGGDDNIKGGAGNDVIHAGPGLDLVLAGDGNDFIFLGTDMGSEVFAGRGDDFIFGNKNAERILGNEGNDWIETGTFDGAPGDNFDEVFAHDKIDGHDVFLGDGGFDEFIGEGGDDIMVGSAGRGKMAGMSGFDWATYKDNTTGVNADLSIPIVFDEAPTFPTNASLDEYAGMEGLSGSRHNDVLRGTNDVAADRAPIAQGGTGGYRGSVLDADGIAMVNGLQAVLGAGVTSFDAGDIILGGDGSDQIAGQAGDDIIDGDKWLDVQIGVYANNDGTGALLRTVNSMKELAAQMFDGTYNAGQLKIIRSIKTADGSNDTDVAIFADVRAAYTVTVNADGSVTVAHTNVTDGLESDGTDTLRNMERLRFADGEIGIPVPPTDIQWNGVTPGNGTPLLGGLATGFPGAGDVIATLASTDADTTTGFTYSLAAGSSADFAVSAAGVVTRTGSTMAQNATYTLNITSTDTTGASRTETFTVQTGTNSVVFGTNGANTINGTAGDNAQYGSGGNDTLNGNDGNDSLFGQDGTDVLNGGNGNDILAGGDDNDTLNGGAGNDTIRYAVGDDADTVNGGADTDALAIAGGGVDDTLDVSFNGTAITNVEGGTVTAVETITADLGGGADRLVYTAAGAVAVNLAAGTASGFTSIAGIENVTGGAGADSITGSAGANALNGGAGNDTIDGGGGNDTITRDAADAGRDVVNGGIESTAAGDRFVINGTNVAEVYRVYSKTAAVAAGIYPLAGTAEIIVTRNTNGTGGAVTAANIIAELTEIEEITINTAGGADTVFAIGSFAGTSLNFNTITINGSTDNETVDISQLESAHSVAFVSNGGDDQIIGDLRPQDVVDWDDVIHGNSADNYLNGGQGNDSLVGNAGDDHLNGGAGADTLYGGSGADTMTGGNGGDRYFVDNAGDVVNELATDTGTDVVYATADWTMTAGSAIEQLRSNYGASSTGLSLTGNDRANYIAGGAAADTLSGNGGNDSLVGNAGDDHLNGGGGADSLFGGAGADTMTGGDGGDRYFVDNAGDVVNELATETGTDVVYATADWIMTSGAAIEQLRSNYGAASTGLSMTGNERGNSIIGGAADDRIEGGAGNDGLNGGGGNDTFVFATGSGKDRVHYFDANPAGGQDRLDISGTGVTAATFAAAVAIDQVGANTIVTIGSDTITLTDVAASAVNQSSFIFA